MGDAATQHLHEIKDIAELYEMWCFFEVQRQVSLALKRQPVFAEPFTVGDLGAHVRRCLRIAWDGGIELFYNLSFSRTRADRSYSLPLRPDVVLRVHRDDGHKDHVFDAKFKVRRIAGEVEDGDEEGRGVFKREDVYKMHAYRDALPSVRSAWVLYPGTELRFYGVDGALHEIMEEVASPPNGVGALPLCPGILGDAISRIVRGLAMSTATEISGRLRGVVVGFYSVEGAVAEPPKPPSAFSHDPWRRREASSSGSHRRPRCSPSRQHRGSDVSISCPSAPPRGTRHVPSSERNPGGQAVDSLATALPIPSSRPLVRGPSPFARVPPSLEVATFRPDASEAEHSSFASARRRRPGRRTNVWRPSSTSSA